MSATKFGSRPLSLLLSSVDQQNVPKEYIIGPKKIS